MKIVAIILLVLSGIAFAGGNCHGRGSDGGGSNFGHCRGAGCFK